ncbi:hypothetical protein PsorP6_006539 [Peronosclerospora sorghi]|uniref:Uncharacterized protein n=1 Tax=Peronosclerospora sorghi TaxID=230839 RepID=A0ACC0W369_9STRA|nr:hypothetical protein PsorP6_006539 [Peronosclerospora sorghi]
MSSRRAGAGPSRSSASRKEALENIKRMREGESRDASASSSRLAQYQPQEESIFKAVTEQEYEDLVWARRQGLPFVENDVGEMGYYDDGEEQFFESEPEDGASARDDDGGDATSKKRSAGALSSSYVRRAKRMQRAKLGGGEGQKISNMFFSASTGTKATRRGAGGGPARGVSASAKREIDLDSMLEDLTSNPTDARQSYSRPMSYSTGFSMETVGSSTSEPFVSGGWTTIPKTVEHVEETMELADTSYEVDDADEPMEEDASVGKSDKADLDENGHDSVPRQEQEHTETEAMKPVMSKRDMMLQKAREARLQTSAPTAKALATPVQQIAPSDNMVRSSVPSNEVAEWWQVAGDDLNVTMTDALVTENEEPQAPPTAEDSIRMYWMDAVEVRDRPGKIYLIGKMKAPSSDGLNQPPTFRSCCVVVNNLQRYMYLVPKGTPLIELSKKEQQDTWLKMHEEIHNILVPSCITNKRDQEVFRTKLVTRNYAFEEANIPRGKNLFLKVKYLAKYAAPPSDVCSRGGKTFSRICGAFTRPLEHFLLTRRLLGPSWVEIKSVRKCTEGVSFCKMEFETFDPKNVSSIAGAIAPPPLTVMSISLKSVCNPNTGKHEVVALSAITETGVNAEGAGKGTNGVRHSLSHFTAIRPLDGNNGFPLSYAEAVKKDDRFGVKKENGALGINNERLRVEINERVMLSYFLTRVQHEDPDVIVGHNFHKYALELLISRVDNFKLGGLWSKLTRLRRGRLNPTNVGEGWNEYRMDDMVNGRLFCDTNYCHPKTITRCQNLEEAKRIGREIQTQCNKHFKLLELEVDAIFKRILLLNKKKYAALVLKDRPHGEPSYEKEVKGLDMVRRDWCVISKTVGNEILDFILSGTSRDEVVENIHEHLMHVSERMRSGKEPIEQYVITKSLNKQPEQYPDRAKQYHVQVAIALRAFGKPVGAGTHIPYVLCKEEEPGTGRRAYHPDEVKRANGKLNLDIEWYLESQIHPPVNRLCAHIEGTSSPQLAHCLGLDTAKFSHAANYCGEENDGADAIPSVLQNDADRFKDCVPLEITCDRCKMASAFPGVFSTSEKDNAVSSGLLCPVCKADFWGFDQEGIYGNVGDDLQAVLSNRLHVATREATKKYYEAWTVCSDVTCKTRTQKQSLRGNGNICSAAGCRATVTLEYPDRALYTQLKYFESLFDVERAQKKIQEQNDRLVNTTLKTEPPVLSERHNAVLQQLRSQAEEAVHRNDYNWVKPSLWRTLFT